MVAVLGLFAMALAVALSSLNLTGAGIKHAAQARESMQVYYVALAGANEAIAEVRAGTDGLGDRASGLGALGITAPLAYLDSAGQKVGEYRTVAFNTAAAGDPPMYVVRSLAAIPSFANPQITHVIEADIFAKEVFLLTPNHGAVSISGPVNTMTLADWCSPDLLIDGGDGAPGLVFSDPAAHAEAIDELGDEVVAGNLDGSEVIGNPLVTYDHSTVDPASILGEFTVSMTLQEDIHFNAQQLNDYRNALRTYAEGLVHAIPTGDSVVVDYARAAAAGVILVHELPNVKDGAGTNKPRIVSDQFLGTPSSPKVALVDTSMFYQGGTATTSNHGNTITGAGTLVIMHPIGSSTDNANGKQFGLDWTGDVFVVGYGADYTTGVGENSPTDNMLFISRSDWSITGNLVVVTAGEAEASVELRGLGSDPASLVVNGSVLVFGDATTNEAEVDVEAYARLEVNGILGVYGARVELENQSSSTTDLIVNGTLAMGLPEGNPRSDDFYWQGKGNTKVIYDKALVEAAAAGLTRLQGSLDLQSASVSVIQYGSSGTLSGGISFSDGVEALDAMIEANGNDGAGDFGVDLDTLGG